MLEKYDHQVLGCIAYDSHIIEDSSPKLLQIKLTVMTMTCELLARKLNADIGNELFYALGNDIAVEVELWETNKFGVKT